MEFRSLSKSHQCQSKLFRSRDQWRCFHGISQPLGQIAVSKQVQPKHRSQIGQRPVGFGEVMQPFQEEQRDQGCPNLDTKCVLAGADKGLHGQVLLERFEQLNDILPINYARLK